MCVGDHNITAMWMTDCSLLCRALLHGCIDYIVETLDCVDVPLSTDVDEDNTRVATATVMQLQRFDGEKSNASDKL